ncbi:MAG: hypothetical protein ABDH61_05850 [Acidilobaceae archaeon]
MPRARVKRRDNLALVEMEGGQRAIVPWRTLCEFAETFQLELVLEEGTKLDCARSKGAQGTNF